jgi:hypothetical protein
LLSYTDTSLTFGNTYYYEVTSTTSGGESGKSNESSAFASGPTVTHLQVNPNPATPTQTVSLTANVASAGGTPHAGSIQFFDNGNPLGSPIAINVFGIATLSQTFAAGTHNFTAAYAGTTGFANSSTLQPVQEIVEGAPTVANVQVNDGSAERSEVRSLTVTFSGPVTFNGGDANAFAAFQLLHVQTGIAVGLASVVSTNADGQTVVTLTFSGSETDSISGNNGGQLSLADGRYQLTILGSMVTGVTGMALDGAGTGTAGSNYVSPTDTLGGGAGQLRLYRLFGDVNGDGIVDQLDLGQFRSSFNASDGNSLYLAFLDADNSGTVDQLDLGQFRTRFNLNVF